MLHDSDGPNKLGGEMAKTERCRPDYEAMIEKCSQRQMRTGKFLDAALMYFEGRTARNKMAELIGELVTENASLMREVENLIKLQEEDPDKDQGK